MISAPFSEVTKSKKNNLDLVRVALALSVILAHSRAFLLPGTVPAALNDLVTAHLEWIGVGRMAVNGFFAISGYLIAKSWVRSSSQANYARKRILRIYPGFTFCILICALVIAPLCGAASGYLMDPQTWAFFGPLALRNIGNIPGAFSKLAAPQVNPVLWTIRFELFCYIMVAVLGALKLLKQKWVILGLFCLSYFVFFLQLRGTISTEVFSVPYFGDMSSFPRLATFFLLGTLLYLFEDVVPYSWWLAGLAIIGWAASRFIPPIYTVPLCFTYLVFFFGFNRSIRITNVAKYGDFSFGLYLYGWPSMQIILLLFPHHTKLTYVPAMLAILALSFALAAASWFIVERPFMRIKGPDAQTGTPAEVDFSVHSSGNAAQANPKETP